MPIYDYACTRCGRVVEVVHGVNGQGPTACETCGGPMKKLLSSPAVHFKGSGWAKKDRGASNATKAAARAGGASADRKASGSAAEGEGATSGASTASDGPTSGASAADSSTAASSPSADQA